MGEKIPCYSATDRHVVEWFQPPPLKGFSSESLRLRFYSSAYSVMVQSEQNWHEMTAVWNDGYRMDALAQSAGG